MAEPRHPPQLKVLFLTEMWERFSYYLMLGILPLYLTDSQKGGMGWSGEETAVVVGSYLALVYFTPFIGGLLADRLLGFRKTIVIGGTLMMFGHLVLAIPNEIGLYGGLLLLILGNGAFKPNISTLLGTLYPPGSPLKDTGYSIFYLGINVGAFICNFAAALARNYFDKYPLQITSDWKIAGWHAAFSTAAVGMFIGLVIFILNYRRFSHVDVDRRATRGAEESLTPLWLQCLLPAAILGAIAWVLHDPKVLNFVSESLGLTHPLQPLLPFNAPIAAFIAACIPVVIFYLNIWRKVPDPADRGRVAGLLVVFGVVIVFWMTFHLNVTALTDWADHNTDRQPNAVVKVITDTMPAFAEGAPPKYFDNAGAEVPRPAKSTYEVVSKDNYEALKKAKELSVVEGKKVYVTQELIEKVYARTDSTTPVLPDGEHLKLTNTELFQSINPGLVVLFTPMMVGLWHFLRLRGWEPSTPAKIGLGLLLTAGSPAVMLWATSVSQDGQFKVSSWWLFGTYAVVTLGELCLSPMGLSLVSKMAPTKIQAFMMGGWFLSTSLGNKLSGIFGEVYHKWDDHYSFWTVLIVCDAVFAGVVFALLPWLQRQMKHESERTH